MSPPTPVGWFPIEIYESIIDFLAGEDDHLIDPLSSVASCALVSHKFLPLARNHLFGDIRLNGARSRDTQSFIQLILHTPDIAQHVSSLNYCLLSRDFTLGGLTETLKKLTRLKSLTINHGQIYMVLEWSKVPLPLRVVLFHRSTLTHLELGSISGFDLSDLAMCPNVKSLSIQKVTLAPIVIGELRKTLRVEKYRTVINERDITSQLCAARSVDGTQLLDFSALRTVDLVVERDFDQNLQGAPQMLPKYGTQITRVVLWIRPKEFYGSQRLPLQGFANTILPSLRTLQHLHVVFLGSFFEDYGLAVELEKIAGNNVIESIKIEAYCDHGDCRSDEWVAFDRALTRDPSAWMNLKTVSMYFDIDTWAEHRVEEVLTRLPENQLHGLMASTAIHLDYNFRASRQTWPSKRFCNKGKHPKWGWATNTPI